jgi:hypothetical protein
MKKAKYLVLTAAIAAASLLVSCASDPAPAGSTTTTTAAKASAPKVLESFEKALEWYPVKGTWNDGDQSKEAKKSTEHATDGASSLELVLDIADVAKGATVYTENPSTGDWSKVKTVVVDIFNPHKNALKVSLAVCSGGNWDWQETAQVELVPGDNSGVRFNLLDKGMKSAATSWANVSDLLYAEDVKRVVFKFTADVPTTGSVFVDNIRLVK